MGKFRDLTGQVFGRLTVMSRAENGTGVMWSCTCDCGHQKDIAGPSLTRGLTQSCGCLAKEATSIRFLNNLTTQTFGRLLVLDRGPNDSHGKATWICRCSCLKTVTVLGSALTSGDTRSCGCLKSEIAAERGRSRTGSKNPQFGKPSPMRGKPGTNLGKTFSPEIREKLSQAHVGLQAGPNNPSWKGGITPRNTRIRHSQEYKAWRKAVFERDDYICQECGARSAPGMKVVLNADHIKPFAHYPELRFSLENGRTLCVECHKKTPTYGNRKAA